MKWTPDETQFADVPESAHRPADDADPPPPLFTAIQEQLGLKLETQKADVPVRWSITWLIRRRIKKRRRLSP